MKSNTPLTTSLIAGDNDDRRQRDEATAKERKEKQKNPSQLPSFLPTREIQTSTIPWLG